MSRLKRFLLAALAGITAAFGTGIITAVVIGVAALAPQNAFLTSPRFDGPVLYGSIGDLILIALSLCVGLITFAILLRRAR